MTADAQIPTGSAIKDQEHGVVFWVAFVIGATVLFVFGVRGLLHDLPSATLQLSFAKWVVGADVVHDLVIAPAACALGALAHRWLSPRVRLPVQSALFASVIVLFLVQNALRGTGKFRHNASIQPLNYATATITVLVVIWLIAGAWIIVRAPRSDQRAVDPRPR